MDIRELEQWYRDKISPIQSRIDQSKQQHDQVINGMLSEYNPVVTALDETIADKGILPYQPKRHNFYTAIQNMDMTPHDPSKPGNIYELMGWK